MKLQYCRQPEREQDGLFSKLMASLRTFDWLQIGIILFLLAVSLTFIHSTDMHSATGQEFFWKQVRWIAMGGTLYLLVANINYRHFMFAAVPAFFCCLILLILVLIPGIGVEVFAARRWLNVPGLGMRLQPSEFMKLTLILVVSTILANRKFNINRISHLCLLLGILALPLALIYIEPDLGMTLLIAMVCGGIIFVSTLKWRTILLYGALFVVVLCGVGVNEYFQFKPLLKEYHIKRIRVFLDPESATSDESYNVRQSRLAVGSGGMWGKGIGEGTQNRLGYLPQTVSNNDFIFSVIAEETGFAGVMVLIFAELLLGYTVFRTAFFATDPFGRYLATGVGCMVFWHCFVNMGMTVGMAPVTGLPLPFVSYGGSFMMVGMAALGIAQSVYRFGRNEEEDGSYEE